MTAKFVLLCLFFFEAASLPYAFGQQESSSPYDPNVKYSVCYELSDHQTKLIKEAYIVGINNVGGTGFLHLTKFDVPAPDADMQLSMNFVIAIVSSTAAEDEDYAFCRPGTYKLHEEEK